MLHVRAERCRIDFKGLRRSADAVFSQRPDPTLKLGARHRGIRLCGSDAILKAGDGQLDFERGIGSRRPGADACDGGAFEVGCLALKNRKRPELCFSIVEINPGIGGSELRLQPSNPDAGF